jgi:predicted AAA+ superfamily ATPase
VQFLYDQDKERYRFILCVSSARRLRNTGTNLLPGRSIRHILHNAAAGIPLTIDTVNADPGRLFEHWIGCQLWRELSYEGEGTLSYYRTTDGAEVDFILETNDEILPITPSCLLFPS